MRISAKAEYACLAMGELALQHARKSPVTLKAISEIYGVSHPFLMQIFLQLKGSRLVQSIRGASGGYQLARSPDEIRLSEIVELMDGPSGESSAIGDLSPQPIGTALRSVWSDVDQAEREILENISLDDLVRRAHLTRSADYQI